MVRSFTDAEGQAWSIELTIGAALGLRDAVGLDVLRLLEADPSAAEPSERIPAITRLDTDYVLLAQTIYCLCEEQAAGREIDQQRFYRRLTGEAFRAAHDALMEALSDFFLALGRQEVAEAIQKQREVLEKTVARSVARLRSPELNEAVEAEITAQNQRTHGSGSGRSPESSESTRGR